MTKKRVLALLLTLVMLLGMLPTSVFAASMSWTWTITLMGGNYYRADGTEVTGSNANRYTVNRYLDNRTDHEIGYTFKWNASAGGSTYNGGWQLYTTVDGAESATNAYVYTRDMSTAADSWTAPKSSHTGSSSHPFTIYLSDYPKADYSNNVTYTLTYDKNTTDTVTNMPTPNPQTAKNSVGKATFFVSEAVPVREGYEFKGWQTSDGTKVGPQVTLTKDHPSMTLYAIWTEHVHRDDDGDGFCDDDNTCMHPKDDNGNCTIDGCTHSDSCCPKPEKPEIPPIPGKDENTIGGSGFDFTCVTEEATHNKTLQVTLRNHPEAYTVGTEVKQKEDPRGVMRSYFEVTVDVAAYLPDYNYFYGTHTICDGEPETLTLTFWLYDSGSWGQWRAEEVKVEEPVIPTEGPNVSTVMLRVQCVDAKYSAVHSLSDYGILMANGTSDGIRHNEETDEYTYSFTISDAAKADFISGYSATNANGVDRGYHVEADGSTSLTITWKWENGEWILVGGDLGLDADGKKTSPAPIAVIINVKCVPDAPTWKDLSGDVKVMCINPTTGKDDCCDWKVSVKSALATAGKYTITKVNDFEYAVTLSASFYAAQYGGNRGPKAEKVAHDLYSKENLYWIAKYADGKWTMTPEADGEDNVVLVTHAPEKWQEIGKMGKNAEGVSTGIKATCTTGSYGPITYGLTTAFVYYDTDVLSVEYQSEGRYLATFKTDKYVENIGKGCNNHFDAARSHKFTSGNETVQWYLSVGVQDETTGKYSWYSEPKTVGTDDVLTVVHDLTVTFDPANGEPAFTQNVFDGETAVEPDEPEKKGYHFDGWYLSENDAFSFDTPITEDITLTAHWTLIPPAADSEPKFTGLKIKVDCTDNRSEHTQGAYTYGLIYGLDNTDGFTKNGWTEEDGAYYYTVTVNKEFYIGRYANTTKTAHTENGDAAAEIRWQWNGTDWQLVTEKDNKDVVLTICVKCEEKQTVNVVIYRNGDFTTAYKTVSLGKMPKGTVIDLTELNIADYYSGKCEFYGWYNDGTWNSYRNDPANAPEGIASLTVNGWTNIICMVYDYEKVVYFASREALAEYQADHSKTEGLLFTTEALHGSALPTVDAPTATRDGYTFTYWSREGQTADVTGQTVGGWTNLYANWEVTPHNIYAYARLNSTFVSLTPDDLKDTLTLNAETLKNLGLGGYNANGFVSIGTFRFDAMALTEELYGAAWDDAEFLAVVDELADNIALETGVSAETAEKIAWTALYKAGEDSGIDAGYPTADEDGYQLTGNLELATVMFQPNGSGVTGMPAVNYTYDDIFEIHDFYLPGQTIVMPADPARAGYDFLGWSVRVIPGEADVEIQALTDDGSLLQSGDEYIITGGGVIFTAQWEARNDTPYKIKYYIENLDGTWEYNDSYEGRGTTDTTIDATKVHNKGYANFTLDLTVEGTVQTGVIAGDGSLVLKLYFTRNSYDYEVRHIKQLPDGSYDEANAEVETLNGKFEALAAVTVKDYGTHYPVNDAAEKQNIQIVKGLVIEVRYDLDSHTLTFETGAGASTISPVTVRHGNAVAKPADPSKEGWKFLGWYEDAAFSTVYDFSTALTEDKTIYAKFELISTPIGDTYVRYDVRHVKQLPDGTYDEENAVVEHLSAKVGTAVTAAPKDYSAEHYSVNEEKSVMSGTAVKPTAGEDGAPVFTILSVYYDLDTHTLTFDPNGGSKVTPETVTVLHGAQVVDGPLLPPTRIGFSFTGWYDDAEGKTLHDFEQGLTEDKTVYAGWTEASPVVVTHRLTINYVYFGGKQAAESKVLDLVPGESYSVRSPRISDYHADKLVVKGIMPDHDLTETVVYMRNYTPGNQTVKENPLKFNTGDHFAYVNGYPDGTVRPEGNVTRAEVAAILYRIMDKTCVEKFETTKSSYKDVAIGDWFNTYVATLENAGVIVDTRAGGYFRPNEAITRAELATMLAQFATTDSSNAASFKDVSSKHWASEEIAIASNMGWINGYPDGTFRPDQTITRAEMMAMVNRALERTPKSVEDLLDNMKVWSDNANITVWYYLDVQEATNSHTYTKSGSRESWKKLL